MRAWILFCLLSLSLPATAAEFSLFLNGEQRQPWTTMLNRLGREGGVAHFTDRSFKIIRQVGSGGTSRIFLLNDGRVLRVALDPELTFEEDEWDTNSVRTYLKGYGPLYEYGVRVVQVFHIESNSREYALAEFLGDQLMTFADFHRQQLNFSPGQLDRLEKDFIDFVVTTRDFSRIDDFRDENVVWTEKYGWILIDFEDQHEMTESVDSRTVLENWVGISYDLKERAEAAIREARLERTCDRHFIDFAQ